MSLKQLPINSAKEHLPDCWHRDRDRHCLRVELNSGEIFLFRYQQLVGVHHLSALNPETLKISFSTHQVVLSGKNLSEIMVALEDLAIAWIKSVPARYHQLAGPDRALITGIEITATE